jgi:hypothetical protein
VLQDPTVLLAEQRATAIATLPPLVTSPNPTEDSDCTTCCRLIAILLRFGAGAHPKLAVIIGTLDLMNSIF